MATVAHKVSDKSRTNDVLISENISFDGLLLSETVLNGLKNAGFIKPSPIQLKAIPLGRCGLDLIVQAKSGTGKTCVFSVIALESICTDSASTQVLVLAPTREIAVQIWEVIKSIGSAMKGLECHTFIGGLPLHEDRVKLKKCHIAVGSPGRIKQLIETGVLRTENIRMFILDEADKLLEEGFQEQINWIYSTLPENKQMLALSATYPEYLADHLTAYMRNPTFLRLNISDPALLGIRQYYQSVTYHPLSHVVFEEKCKILIQLLSSISFQQCLVFSNVQTRASNLADMLTNKGWPTACIAGCLDQKDRNHAMSKLKTYKCRILISTDLTARGIDADRVNVVINMDIPKDHETYLHRIGRAGRFGAFGIAISLVSEGQEKMNMNMIEKRCNTTIHPLPDPLPTDLAKAESPVYLNDVVSTEVINTERRDNKNTDVDEDRVKSQTNLSEVNGSYKQGDAEITHAEITHAEITHKKECYKGHKHHDFKPDAEPMPNGNIVKQVETVPGKKEFTLYDLDQGSRNGLNFTNEKVLDMKPNDVDRNITYKSHGKTRMLIHKVKNDLSGYEQLHSKTTASVKLVNDADKDETSLPSTSQEKDLTEDTANKTNKNVSDNVGDKPITFKLVTRTTEHSADANTVSFPKRTDVNLSNIFKHSIGYKRPRDILNYSTARQSLKEFRDTFSGDPPTPVFTIPKTAAAMENKELLKVAVTQLQELFDRNLTVKGEPGDTPGSPFTGRFPKSPGSPFTGQVTEDSMSAYSAFTERFHTKEAASFQGQETEDSVLPDILPENVKMKKETLKDKPCVVGTQKVASTTVNEVTTETSVISEGKDVLHIDTRQDVKPKANRPKKHFTNRFAIAHMVQPGESVFEYGGVVRNSIEERGLDVTAKTARSNTDDVVHLEGRVDSGIVTNKEELVGEYDHKQSSPAIKQGKIPPVENLVLDDVDCSKGLSNDSSIPRVHSRSPKAVIGNGNSRNHYHSKECEIGVSKPRRTAEKEPYYKPLKTENKPNKVIPHREHSDILEEYTSDSESDSTSDSDTSGSSEDEINQHYRDHSSHNTPYNPHLNQGPSHWQYGQYPYPPSPNYQGRSPGFPDYQGRSPGFPDYQGRSQGFPDYQSYHPGYPLHYQHYQHTPFSNPYSQYFDAQAYGRGQDPIDQTSNYSMKTTMERCLKEQRDYIKEMSKYGGGRIEEKKMKKRSKKKKSK